MQRSASELPLRKLLSTLSPFLALLSILVGPHGAWAEVHPVRPGEITSWGGNGCNPGPGLPGLRDVASMAINFGAMAVVRKDGTAISWATDNQGNPSDNRSWGAPVNNSNIVAVAVGVDNVLALRLDGSVINWGSSSDGTPPPGLDSVWAIATGHGRNLGLKSDGTVVAWNNGSYRPVPAHFKNIVAIAVGGDVLAVRRDGTVVAELHTPPSWLAGVVQVAEGLDHHLALREDGTVAAWGQNSGGQASVPIGLSGVVAIAAGNGFSLALKSDGTVVSWGLAYYGCNGANRSFTNLNGITAIAAAGDIAIALGGSPSHSVPAIFSIAGEQTIGAGGTAPFLVTASGTEPMTYQWQLNGTNIPGANNSSLVLTNVQSTQAGLYSVAVSNAFGTILSTGVGLKVDSSPVKQANLFVTNLADAGPGSLRQAILDANEHEGDDAIGILTTGTIFASSELPTPTGNTTIIGPGTNLLTLSADYHPSRLFRFAAKTTNNLSGMTIANGWLTNRANGAAILNNGTLTLTKCLLVNQTIQGGSGAAIFNQGDLRVQESVFGNNSVLEVNSADLSPNAGGAIHNSGSLLLEDSTFMGNSVSGVRPLPEMTNPAGAAKGGAVYCLTGSLRVTRCNFMGNQVRGGRAPDLVKALQGSFGGAAYGGALCIDNGMVSITASTIASNTVTGGVSGNGATGNGGGIYLSAGALTLLNTTVSGNLAEGGISWQEGIPGIGGDARGAGICVSGGDATITSSTIATNQVHAGTQGRDVGHALGGGIYRSSGTVRLKATLVGDNGPDYYAYPTAGPEMYGIFVSQGFNLIRRTLGASGFVASDLVDTNGDLSPMIGPLQDNGGPTMTHALLAGSPAIDAASSEGAPAFDQRGVLRPQRLGIDIGAYESPPEPITINGMVPSKSVFRGTNVTLWVDASGNPPLRFQWRLNGTNLTGATNVTFTLSGITESDAGIYSVLVRTPFNSATGSMTLTVLSPPYIISPPVDQTVITTMNVLFHALAGGTQPFRYQWRFNDSDLQGETRPTLEIPNVQLSDAGGYAVFVSNPFGSVTSTVARLEVHATVPVDILVQGLGRVSRYPDKPGYFLGEIVTLSAIADRWNGFSHWSDGPTDNPRVITVRATNNFTAVFTPIVPLETITIGGISRTAPIGEPVILVDGEFVPGGKVTRVDSAYVEIQSSFDRGTIFITLDGSEPIDSASEYFAPLTVRRSAILRAAAWNSQHTQRWDADPVELEIVPAFTVTAKTMGGGTVALSPAVGPYASNSLVTLSAMPLPGFTFLQWLGDAAGTNPIVSLKMTRPVSVEAIFATHLSRTVTGSGSLVVDPLTDLYPYGTVVRVTALPDDGYYFTSWGKAASGTNNPLQFTVAAAEPVVASLFTPLAVAQSTLMVLTEGSGHVTAIPRANRYKVGTVVTLTAVPEGNQSFVGWSGDATGLQNPLSLTMDQKKKLTATFTARPVLTGEGQGRSASEGFRLSLVGQFGGHYLIERSTDFLLWEPWIVLTNSYGETQILDALSPHTPVRFYKASETP